MTLIIINPLHSRVGGALRSSGFEELRNSGALIFLVSRRYYTDLTAGTGYMNIIG